MNEPEPVDLTTSEILALMDELAEEIGAFWPEGITAAEAVAEQRRSLGSYSDDCSR